MKNSVLLLLCTLLLCFNTFSQQIKWNTKPQKGFVYQISNKEAQRLLTVQRQKNITKKLLYNPVDTFNIEDGWTNRPEKGHFILVNISGNGIKCRYTSVFPYRVFLLKEYNALAIQVLDGEGNVRTDAKVRLGRFNKIPADSASKTYRIENPAFFGEFTFATVELDGFRSVFNIQKHDVPQWYDNNYSDDSGPDFYSYLVTDKNQYKPGEKVRFKSYALSHLRMPIRKELEIWLSAYPKDVRLGTITPHRPGSFAGEFILHDSLKLKLDQRYYLQLRDRNRQVISSCSFTYQDYELSGNRLELQLDKAIHFYPDTNKLTITAIDENGLMLKDARAVIVVKTNTILGSFEPLSILADTLMTIKQDLDPEKPSVICIPPGLFRKTNTSYNVVVSVINNENTRMENSREAVFYYSNIELKARLEKDSICFNLLKNDVPMQDIPVFMRVDNEAEWQRLQLPYREKINPALRQYHFKHTLITKDIHLNELNPAVEIKGGIERDSLKVWLENPHKLAIAWFIYQGGVLLERGSGNEFEFSTKIDDHTQNYYAEVLYSFGGEDKIRQRVFEFRENYLDISLDVPDKVYPGQEVNALVSVKDQHGNPVKGVDLLAMATTSKLDYSLPSLPYYGNTSLPRSMAVHYSKTDKNNLEATFGLDYEKWKKIAGLDTMLYYQFIYPKAWGFKYSTRIIDSTQFAPFVMYNGEAQEVFVIEVDHMPVYYSWVDKPDEYSFYIDPGRKHVISLRLSDRVIELDSMQFEKGTKTIFSILSDNLPFGSKVTKLENRFSKDEIYRMFPTLASFSGTRCKFSYLYDERQDEFIPLFGKTRNYGYKLVGPLTDGKKTYTESCGTNITYWHRGGFNYEFDENVVYKTNAENLLPQLLFTRTFNPMDKINDLEMTRSSLLKLTGLQTTKRKWQSGTIDMVDSDGRLRIFLPEVRDAGIAAVIFRNSLTKAIIAPFFDKNTSYSSAGNTLPIGIHSLIVLYTDGKYLVADSVPMRPYHHYVIDFTTALWHEADSSSFIWLNTYEWDADRYETSQPKERRPDKIYQVYANQTGNVTGSVYDENNDPLPGVVVMIKGTQTGTITDINGHFALQIDDYSADLVVSFIGYREEELQVTRGSEVRITLQAEVMMLQEVVVVGYSTKLKRELTSSVSMIQGKVSGVAVTREENANQVIPDDIPGDSEKEDAEKQLYEELLTLKTIRSNFSDVGFWEPKLYTDNHGESGFTIKFPDDITRWDAVVYAMNRRLQTGTLRKSIRSYKPLMSQLSMPAFLTRGDSAIFTGKVLNYTHDTVIKGSSVYTAAGSRLVKDISFHQYCSERLPFYAGCTDSAKISYVFTRDDGYMDGEERTIPVQEQGILRAEGSLEILKNGDTLNIKAAAEDKVIVELLDSQLDIYMEAARGLVNYRYLCNEQLASRLIGLINYKRIMQFEGKPFRFESDINTILTRLLRNQNEEFLWSWWDNTGNTSYWMSAHILRALRYAGDAGYQVNLDISNIARKAEYKFEFLKAYSITDIDLLQALAVWDAKLNYKKYLQVLDTIVSHRQNRQNQESLLREKFLLQEIRQMKGLGYERDSLAEYRKEGILGDVHFSDGKPASYWYDDELAATNIAYRIIKKDSVLQKDLAPMQLYFITTLKNNGWNTYQASNLLMSILPDLLAEGASKEGPATVHISGKEEKAVSRFPYHIELLPGENINIQKQSGIPLYYMQYIQQRVKDAATGVEGFRIRTWFTGNNNILEAGKPVDLIVDVEVEKNSAVENVMIEVPVPASCSYAQKTQNRFGAETHREYYKEKTVIFCERLNPGKYTFTISLLPRYTGIYMVNPALVSLMYFPVVNANTGLKNVVVR